MNIFQLLGAYDLKLGLEYFNDNPEGGKPLYE